MIKALIIDDEKDARELLKQFVAQFCEDVFVKEDFESPITAFEYLKINHQDIDLIYLDISMPKMDGLSFLKLCKDYNIQTIFITAHDEYAIQAIRLSAIDYILKPIDIDILIKATDKAKEVISSKTNKSTEVLSNFISNAEKNDLDKKVLFHAGNEIVFIKLKDIIYLEADGNYTTVFAEGHKKFIISERLGAFEEMLHYPFIYRAHRGYLINLYKIEKYQKGRGGIIIMTNGTKIPVSQRNKTEFIEKLKNIQ